MFYLFHNLFYAYEEISLKILCWFFIFYTKVFIVIIWEIICLKVLSYINMSQAVPNGVLTLYHTVTTFNYPEEKQLLKTLWEKEKMLVTIFPQYFLLFP